MRLSSACIPAVLAAGLLWAGAAPAKAQFAPTPYDPSNIPPPAGAETAPEALPPNGYPPANGYPPGNGYPPANGYGAEAYDPSAGVYAPGEESADEGDYTDGEWGCEGLGRAIPYCGAGRVYGTGGICNPRYFDISFEYLELHREEISRRVEFMSQGVAGPRVLTTDDLDFHDETGFRVSGAWLFEPGTNLEATYMGTFHFQDRVDVVDPTGQLFSAFSDFGTNPGAGFAPSPNQPGVLLPVDPGFVDTDEGTFANIIYSSQLNSFELNMRRRWLSPNGRVHTSALIGARWVNVSERFRHYIETAPGLRTGLDGNAGFTGINFPVAGAFAYDVRVSNNLIGFQVGQEIVAAVNQFFRFGGEAKAGIYGNDMELTSEIASGVAGKRHEFIDNADAAFVGEANIYGLVRLNSMATLKGGWTVLFIDGVALAPEQVDFSNPFVTGLRGFGLNDDGNILYHGFHCGMELNW